MFLCGTIMPTVSESSHELRNEMGKYRYYLPIEDNEDIYYNDGSKTGERAE
jgi:hypothetical protein